MAPVVILIRHAQAQHKQCKTLADDLEADFAYPLDDCRIVVSPLSRTLQTVHYSLGWLLDRDVPVEARAEWQEDTDNPCDIGAERSQLEKVWPNYDFSKLDPVYPQKTGLYGPSEKAIQERASVARRWLSEQPEKCIIVVTHSGFLNRVVQGPRYKNVEYRTYRTVRDNSGEVELVELKD
ncbi:histidine phosphatase superfamily [Xylaria nigripes]|nr:histidine phosphatase superfamily [Xylaria nigripes]